MQSHPRTTVRPFLRWAGGKQRIAQTIWSCLPAARRLIEPFVGAGSMFLSAPPAFDTFLLSDANSDLMALWSWLKVDADGLMAAARHLFNSESNSEDAYALARERFNRSADLKERALLLLYLNKLAFNGLYRVNRRGEFNVPYGGRHNLTLPDAQLRAVAQVLQRATLLTGDFEEVIALAESGDLVYADPPYLPLNGAPCMVGYTSRGFGIPEHERLALALRSAVERGATVATSNHDTGIVRDLYSGFEFTPVAVRRSVSAKATSRQTVQEVLALLRPS